MRQHVDQLANRLLLLSMDRAPRALAQAPRTIDTPDPRVIVGATLGVPSLGEPVCVPHGGDSVQARSVPGVLIDAAKEG